VLNEAAGPQERDPGTDTGHLQLLQQSTQQSATSLDLLPGFIFWTTSFFSDT